MKNQRATGLKILLAVILAIPGSHAIGQIDFEGKVTYQINYTTIPAEMEGYESLLPVETTTYLKSRSSRSEITMPMGGTQTMIYNADTEVALMLMDMLGSKTAVPFLNGGVGDGDQNSQDTDITYFDEYKMICGYHCQKAQVKCQLIDGTVINATVYYTIELRNNTRIFGGLNGLPLEYTTSDNGVHSTVTATSVTTEPVPDVYVSLVIPEGYDVADLE